MAMSIINQLPSSCRMRFHLLLAKEAVFGSSLRLGRHGPITSGQFGSCSKQLTRAVSVFLQKRKLPRTTVAESSSIRLQNSEDISSTSAQTCYNEHYVQDAAKTNKLAKSCLAKSPLCSTIPSMPIGFLHHQKSLWQGSFLTGAKNPLLNTLVRADDSSSHFANQIQPVRTFQHDGRDKKSRRKSSQDSRQDSVEDFEDRQKILKLRANVVYIPNPLQYPRVRWNIMKLRWRYDPNFTETEFLYGAKQAISRITNMMADGQFEELRELVLDEVITYLQKFTSGLSDKELTALPLDPEDIVMIKIHDCFVSKGVPKEGDVFAYVDTICFGLTLLDRIPYFINVGFRFARDYTTPEGTEWIVSGLTHVKIQCLGHA